jgi:GntR family transcriptional regulator, transcriptional repressor for pyruvate dehydrogenase complex
MIWYGRMTSDVGHHASTISQVCKPLHPRRESLADSVAESILDLIVSEDLEENAPLPSEAKLAENFVVSRVVVREACRTLASRGMIEIRHGRGMFVKPWSATVIHDSLHFALRRDGRLFEDLLETRFSIEVQATQLAAERATSEHVAQLRDLLHATEAVLEDFERLARADVAFHDGIFAASGNAVLAFIGAGFQSLLVESRRLTYAGSLYRGETARVALADHQRILAAIERRDAGAAGEAMQAHLSMTRDTLVTAYERLRSLGPMRLKSEEILALAIDAYREKGTAQPTSTAREESV